MRGGLCAIECRLYGMECRLYGAQGRVCAIGCRVHLGMDRGGGCVLDHRV